MNRYGPNIKINAKMGKILIESSVLHTQENEWLYTLLRSKAEPIIKYEEIENLEEDKKSFLQSSLFTNLYKAAANEWEIDHKQEDEEKMDCTLCGRKDTTRKYFIKNKINGTMFNVGSDCVNNFGDIRGPNGKTLEEFEREWKIQNRDKLLNNKYPGIIIKMDNWSKEFDSIPTIIKSILEEEYFTISKKAFELREKFRKQNKEDYTIAKEINKLVVSGENVLQKIYQDVEEKQKNEWFITKEIKEWCYKSNEDKTLEIFLKEDGLVTWKSACRIYEPNFVEKIVKKLKNIFVDLEITIREYDDKRKSIIVSVNDGNIYNNRINLVCSYNEFLSEFGNSIFNDNITLSNEKDWVIAHSEIVEENSLNMSVSNFKNLLRKYSLNINSWSLEYNEIIFTEYLKTKDTVYQILDLKKFVKEFISFLFKKNLTEEEAQNIKNHINNNSSTMTGEEYKERLARRKREEKAMQVDYSKFN